MKVVIAQSDVVTAYGWGMPALWNGLLGGKTAVKCSARFADRKFAVNQVAAVPDLHVDIGGSRSMAMLARLLAPLIGRLDPLTPLLVATTVGEIEYLEQAVFSSQPRLAAQARPDVLLGRIKRLLQLTGPAMVVSSACASSTAAVARAASMIRHGEAPAVLVVTCDSVSEFVYAGFSTLLSLCETPARPFDAERSGLSLGEAAAWALITSDIASPDADSTAIVGWGSTTDAVHMTAPDRNAGGLSRAISKACAMAGRNAAEIDFIAAHGTATIYNDAMELVAFRNAIRKAIPVFSIKGAVGHTLATAGLLQILVTARAMSENRVPPTVGMSVPDPDADGWVHATPVAIAGATLALSTNSGFGGVNTAILLDHRGAHRDGLSTNAGKEPEIASWRLPFALHPQRQDQDHRHAPGAADHREAEIDSLMPAAVAWFTGRHYGTILPGEKSLTRPSPALGDSKEMLALIDRPIKYLARMGPEARSCLAAASLAIKAAGWRDNPPPEIGILAAGYDGWLAADEAYFRDYVAGGLTLGRGNLFIYTLPTSTQGEISIALSLNGPTLHIQDDAHPVAALFHQAGQLIDNQEADAVLVLYSDAGASICFAIDRVKRHHRLADFPWDAKPLEMAQSLAAKAHER
ncbi:MAG TPA: beta-ketoacyl synthase N-terminal-like domain-containing protein [Tepidisphaeraceae bacterium]|jgi:3-oxoacyl-[acyl-carrier-protein] synthase II|nr:beta-ketoacyl synthase N-terminal-like domain-containing protein [Tepidisphaeraceae bacterium]